MKTNTFFQLFVAVVCMMCVGCTGKRKAQPDDALTGPVLPALRQDWGFFHVRDFQKTAAFPPDSF